ncbi:hypothetical protein DPEC_G00153430 [Dallia pectoralis]|uniref:Uncharacterized protein n=1 Tax=Dallia pectoralis TaxID=75939 RepID=A0ACC2GK48_DALPE|nr:hypothetical protein DPEC_G00153430 [Dallia pectoralis]
MDNASSTATSKPLVFPALGQHFQASAEEKTDKLLTTPTKVPRNSWQLVRPLGPKQETIQPSKPKPIMSQSTYYRKIWAFRQECLSQQAPPTRTRRQPEDNTLPTLFVNTGPLLGRKAGQKNALPKHLAPKPPVGPRPTRFPTIDQSNLCLVGTKFGKMK